MAVKNMVPENVWDTYADLYELGLKHGNRIAMELGVSPQTVSREMRKRGAIKGRRVCQSVLGLEKMLDRKAKRAALMKLSDSQRKRKVSEANMKLLDYMMASLLEANRQGDLTAVDPLIERINIALSGKHRKRV